MKILVCVDMSPQAEATVQFGGYLTQILDGQVALLHVAAILPVYWLTLIIDRTINPPRVQL